MAELSDCVTVSPSTVAPGEVRDVEVRAGVANESGAEQSVTIVSDSPSSWSAQTTIDLSPGESRAVALSGEYSFPGTEQDVPFTVDVGSVTETEALEVGPVQAGVVDGVVQAATAVANNGEQSHTGDIDLSIGGVGFGGQSVSVPALSSEQVTLEASLSTVRQELGSGSYQAEVSGSGDLFDGPQANTGSATVEIPEAGSLLFQDQQAEINGDSVAVGTVLVNETADPANRLASVYANGNFIESYPVSVGSADASVIQFTPSVSDVRDESGSGSVTFSIGVNGDTDVFDGDGETTVGAVTIPEPEQEETETQLPDFGGGDGGDGGLVPTIPDKPTLGGGDGGDGGGRKKSGGGLVTPGDRKDERGGDDGKSKDYEPDKDERDDDGGGGGGGSDPLTGGGSDKEKKDDGGGGGGKSKSRGPGKGRSGGGKPSGGRFRSKSLSVGSQRSSRGAGSGGDGRVYGGADRARQYRRNA